MTGIIGGTSFVTSARTPLRRSVAPKGSSQPVFSSVLAKTPVTAPSRKLNLVPTSPVFGQEKVAAEAPPAPSVRATAAAPVDAGGPVPYASLIESTARKAGIDPALLAAVAKTESNFNPNAQSGVGAKGLMQLMDGTARTLGVSDPFNPAQSLEGGARFLAGLLKQFHGDVKLALAAYNAGPVAVQKYGGIPPYEETQRYVPKVLGFMGQYQGIWGAPSDAADQS